MSEVEGQIRDEQLDAEREQRRQFALAQVRQYPDPVLRLKAREIDEFDEALVALATRMGALMQEARGVGLAAPQIGVLQRILVYQADEEEPVRALVNPRVVSSSDVLETADEGCLSLGAATVVVEVERPEAVVIEARSPEGEELRIEADGLSARVLQHELDHLDGVLIVDRASPETRKEALARLRPQPVLRPASLRLAVAATAPFGAAVLEGLAERHDIELLLTRPDRPRGRGRKVAPPPAKAVAERLGIPVEQPERLQTFPGRADTGIVAAYGVLIPESLLGERLWLNVHPSLLPRWRGAAPVERALMAGDVETGVTIHRTTSELDAGPIAAQRSFAVGPEDDAGAVFERAAKLAVELLDEVLPEPEFTPQSGEGLTYAEKIGPADRDLDWSRPADELVNRVRALSPHIGARGEVDGQRLLVWKARPASPNAELVAGGVELLEVQPEAGAA